MWLAVDDLLGQGHVQKKLPEKAVETFDKDSGVMSSLIVPSDSHIEFVDGPRELRADPTNLMEMEESDICVAPLSPAVYNIIYAKIWLLAFEYVAATKRDVYRDNWGNFGCLNPPWRLRFQQKRLSIPEMFALSSDIFLRESLFFPFFEDTGWAWLLVIRSLGAARPDWIVYDFSNGANGSTIARTMECVAKFLAQSWAFFRGAPDGKGAPRFDAMKPRFIKTPQVSVVVSGWYMLHTLECLMLTTNLPVNYDEGVLEMRNWLRDVLCWLKKEPLASPEEDADGESTQPANDIIDADAPRNFLHPDHVGRLSKMCGCSLI